jgi:hypothetical protein
MVFRSFVLLIHKARKWLSTLKFYMPIMLDINQGGMFVAPRNKRRSSTTPEFKLFPKGPRVQINFIIC